MIELEDVLPAIFKTFKGKNKIEIKLNPCVDVNIYRKSWDDKDEMYYCVGEFKNDEIIMKQLNKISYFFDMDEVKKYLQNMSLGGYNLIDIDSYMSMNMDSKFLTACCIVLIHDFCSKDDDIVEEISGYDDPQIYLNIEVENFGANIEYSVEVEEAPSCDTCSCVNCECCGECGCHPCECCSYCECAECECDECDECGFIESECECCEYCDSYPCACDEDDEDEDEDEDDEDDEDDDEDEGE